MRPHCFVLLYPVVLVQRRGHVLQFLLLLIEVGLQLFPEIRHEVSLGLCGEEEVLNSWEAARVLLHFERFLLLLPLQRRAVLNRVEGHHLPTDVSVSTIDQDVVVDVLDPIEVLQQRYFLIDENSSLLLEHGSHQLELAQLRRVFLVEAQRADMLERAPYLRRQLRREEEGVVLDCDEMAGEFVRACPLSVVGDSQLVEVVLLFEGLRQENP